MSDIRRVAFVGEPPEFQLIEATPIEAAKKFIQIIKRNKWTYTGDEFISASKKYKFYKVYSYNWYEHGFGVGSPYKIEIWVVNFKQKAEFRIKVNTLLGIPIFFRKTTREAFNTYDKMVSSATYVKKMKLENI